MSSLPCPAKLADWQSALRAPTHAVQAYIGTSVGALRSFSGFASEDAASGSDTLKPFLSILAAARPSLSRSCGVQFCQGRCGQACAFGNTQR
jgi:hypothetical protein